MDRDTYIFCDGGSRGTNLVEGEGGWGISIHYNNGYKQGYNGYEPIATNSLMEIKAMSRALSLILEQDLSNVVVLTDSSYVLNCIKDKWYASWENNGWKTSKKEPVAHRREWEELIGSLRELEKGFRNIRFAHINSHIPKSQMSKSWDKFNKKNFEITYDLFEKLVIGNEEADSYATMGMNNHIIASQQSNIIKEYIEEEKKEEEIIKKDLHKPKIIAIIGKAGSGKSTMAKKIEKHNEEFYLSIQDTTRPIRDYEQDGLDYNFISIEEFKEKAHIEDYLVKGSWNYGYSVDELKGSHSILVVNPTSYIQVLDYAEKNNYETISFYIAVPWQERVKRMIDRGDELSEIYRRVTDDEGHFSPLETMIRKKIGDNIPIVIDGRNSINEVFEDIIGYI